MATSSFNHDIVIEDTGSADRLARAMEAAEQRFMKGDGVMVRTKINLDTMSKVKDFVAAASQMSGTVRLIGKDESGAECVVNARSLMGAIYSMEWNEVWCEHYKNEECRIRQFTY